jgi:hypothetical protein
LGLVLALSAGLALSSCASSPKEKTDELDGTEWIWRMSDTSSQTFKFRHGGKYHFTEFLGGTSEGTYTIDGDKIITVHKGGSGGDIKATYVFSEDRQRFWQEFGSGKHYYQRRESWGELFGKLGKKKKEGDA